MLGKWNITRTTVALLLVLKPCCQVIAKSDKPEQIQFSTRLFEVSDATALLLRGLPDSCISSCLICVPHLGVCYLEPNLVAMAAMAVDQKLLRQTKFPAEFNQKVDMQKVNVEVMKKYFFRCIAFTAYVSDHWQRIGGLQARSQKFSALMMTLSLNCASTCLRVRASWVQCYFNPDPQANSVLSPISNHFKSNSPVFSIRTRPGFVKSYGICAWARSPIHKEFPKSY